MALDRDEVARLYEDDFLGVAAIARRLGTNAIAVAWCLGTAGIPLRNKSDALKGRPKSPEHRAKLAESLRLARASQTDETRKKQSDSMKGRTPPNKGEQWSEETRARHAYRQTDEYRQAQVDRFRGEKSPLWRGGTSDAESRRMQSWEWKQRRLECYERDSWTCQDCSVHCGTKGKHRIQAHHIVSRRHGGGDELKNLVTLCASCHHRRERRK